MSKHDRNATAAMRINFECECIEINIECVSLILLSISYGDYIIRNVALQLILDIQPFNGNFGRN